MDATVRSNPVDGSLLSLRKKAIEYANQAEDEDLLAEVIMMLSGDKRPCAYTREEMAANLREADEDYKAGRFVTQEEIRAMYGL